MAADDAGANIDGASVALQRLLAVIGASFEQRAHLQRALDSRIEIEQAKGILSERLRLTLDDAFELLRRTARNNRRRIHDIAHEVVEQPETPPQLLVSLQETLTRRPAPGRR